MDAHGLDTAPAAVPAPRTPLGLLRARAARLSEAQRAAVRDAWRALLATRLLVWTSGMGAFVIFGRAADTVKFDPFHLTDHFGTLGNLLVSPASRWDAAWYLAIAQDGYTGEALGRVASRPAFFPLYPLLVRVVGAPGIDRLLAGIAVSLLAFFIALVLMHRLTALELGTETGGGQARPSRLARWAQPGAPRLAVVATAVFPMALFFSAVYSESLYLALSLGVFWAARTGRWAWAGALGALAAGTRSTGVLLAVPLLVLYLYGPRPDGKPTRWARTAAARPRAGWRRLAVLAPRYRPGLELAWLALVPAGLGAYIGYLALAGVDPLAPFHTQEVWFRHFAGPFGGLVDGTDGAIQGARQLLSGSRYPVYFHGSTGDPFNVAGHNVMLFAFLAYGLMALVGVARRLPVAYAVYVVVALALPLSYPVSPQPLMSLPRFLVALFPLHMWLGSWLAGHRRARVPVLVALALGLAFFSGEFATWHWMA
ncbi:MAG TPA: mannosyltransferase family protein [Solirubrobacteraceae bacterium]|jgi:hypothetical protein|nr:mannosyltransferase family protein [Solirubrobacteraceae bacterium]